MKDHDIGSSLISGLTSDKPALAGTGVGKAPRSGLISVLSAKTAFASEVGSTATRAVSTIFTSSFASPVDNALTPSFDPAGLIFSSTLAFFVGFSVVGIGSLRFAFGLGFAFGLT